jgi:PAS domain S-box-containing protein
MRAWIGLLVLALMMSPALAAEPAAEPGFIGPRADHFLDRSGALTLDDVTRAGAAARFTPSSGRVANYGVNSNPAAALWLRVEFGDLARLYRGEWALVVREPRVREATLYVATERGWSTHAWIAGKPLAEGGRWSTRYPLFMLPATELAGRTAYLRIQTRSSLRGALWLHTDVDFLGAYAAENLAFGIMAGILAALTIYLLAIGLVTRDRALIGTSGGALAYLAYVVGDQGFVEMSGLPSATTIGRILSFGGTFLIYGCWLYFETHYLRLAQHLPRIGLAIGWLIRLSVMLALVATASVLFEWTLLRRISALFGVLTLVSGLSVAIVMFLYERRRATIFLLCWLPAIVGGLLRLMHDVVPAIGAQPFAVSATYLLTCLSFLAFGVAVSIEIQARERDLRNVAEASMGRLTAFADYASDSLWEADAAGRITFATGPVTAAIGLSPGTALGKQIAGLAAPGMEEPVAAVGSALSGGQSFHQQITVHGGGTLGGERTVTVTGVPITAGSSGVLLGHRGFMADITDDVRRRARENQQDKMAAIGQLAGGIAHEINNMLHPIVNLSRRVARSLSGDDERRRLLDIVSDSGVRAAAIVSALLTSVRPSMSKDEALPLRVAVLAAVEQLRPILPEKITLAVVEGTTDGPLVQSNDVFQLLTNLVANAVHATRASGRIVVSLVSPPGGGAVLAVEDDGEGMSEETRRRALDPFFTTKAPGQGTGLGLPIVYGIVRSWKATLDIESRQGIGTRIVIAIPGNAAPGEGSHAVAAQG